MTAREVYNSRDCYQKFPFVNCSSNLTNLRAAIDKDHDREMGDLANYRHDKLILTTRQAGQPPRPIPWHRSEAKKLLKKDIDDNKHNQMKKELLYKTSQLRKCEEKTTGDSWLTALAPAELQFH